MKNKKKWTIIAILLIVIMLIPVPIYYKDGGTIKYQAVLWSMTKWHEINGNGYYIATDIRILFFTFKTGERTTNTEETQPTSVTEQLPKSND